MAFAVNDLKEIADKYAAKLAALFGLPASALRDITFQIVDTQDFAGDASMGPIKISSTVKPGDLEALVVHEMAHKILGGSPYKDDKQEWFYEGLSDWAASELTGKDINTGEGPRSGYTGTAKFLRWIEEQKPGTMQAVVKTVTGPNSMGVTAAKAIADATGTRVNAWVDQYKSEGGTITNSKYAQGTPPLFVGNTDEDGGLTTTEPPGGEGDGADGADGPTRKEREDRMAARKNLRSGFVNAVREFGIPMTQNIQALISAGIEGKYNYDRFLNYLRQTPDYRKTFPGIFDDNGGLKMTEAQYLGNKVQYEQYASRYGVNMSDGKMAWLFKNDVDPTEFADRAPALTRLRENKDLYGAFGKELVDSGLAKPKDVDSPKEMFRFVMGAGNKAWYDLWQDAATRYTAEEAGLTIAGNRQGYTNLNQRIMERVSGKGLSEESMAEGFQNIAEELLTVLPLSRIQQYGLSKRDIVTAQFGGKGSARIRQTMKKIVEQDEAFHENRAVAPTYASEEGVQTLGGNKQKAQDY